MAAPRERRKLKVNFVFRSSTRTFTTHRLDTHTRFEKFSSKLDISRSLIRIFEVNLEDTDVRFENYSSKLDISRSLIRIFAEIFSI